MRVLRSAGAPAGRPTVRSLVVLLLAVACLAVAGCAPRSPDHSSWTDQAHSALEDTASEVATVSLLLRLEEAGKVPGKYQQVVAQDSEAAVGATLARFGAEQPPPRDDETYAQVTGLISDASDLLARVRIAIVRRDTGEYPALLDELESTHADLTGAADALAASSGAGT